MTHPLKLAFLWHMHQPDYRDTEGVMSMPWVFLHAIKDYYEMPWMLSRFEGIEATFNLTSPLIEQLKLYRDPLKNDRFLQLWYNHPSQLGSSERDWLIKLCKSPHYDTMVRPLPRFAQLYERTEYNDEELIEFELLFMLAWCGQYLRFNDEIVGALLAQERGYTQHDKERLLKRLEGFVQEIIPYYSRLQDEGKISVSTTPYNHPILPLLVDMENARHANIHTNIPDNHLPLTSDAVRQVEKAIDLYRECFGRDPQGFWPAEGAVDAKTVEIYREKGIKWIATDEAILFKSLGSDHRSALYRPYLYNGVSMGFRDHGLSDLIGFDYRYKPAKEAAAHFIEALSTIATKESDPTVFVILDGENAWEYYPGNAYDFFDALYTRLQNSPWCRSVRMDDAVLNAPVALDNLAPGSWIHGDFSTWVGHSEKTRGWELLFQTRRDYETRGMTFDAALQTAIETHFLAAECSDWFWWYGDDHSTEFGAEFDLLFRKHLIAVYELMQMNPPADLLEPIIAHKSTASFKVEPQFSIKPRIDGKAESFFEWIGAGMIDETRLFSTMDKERGPVECIRFGHDDEGNVYISMEGALGALCSAKTTLRIIIEETAETICVNIDGCNTTSDIPVKVVSSLEMELSRERLGEGTFVHLRFELEQDKRIVQTLPGYGALKIRLDEDYSSNWFV